MLFFILRHDENRLTNSEIYKSIQAFLEKNSSQYNETYYSSIFEIDEYIQGLFLYKGICIGGRNFSDYDSFSKVIHDNLNIFNDCCFYMFASIEEIKKIVQELGINLRTNDFDVLKLSSENNLFKFEEINFQLSSFNKLRSIHENMGSLIRINLYQELCSERSSKEIEEVINLREVMRFQKRTQKVLDNLKILDDNREMNFKSPAYNKIVKKLKNISNKAHKISDNVKEIIQDLRFETNACPERTEYLIKYPTIFSPESLYIEHRQSDDFRSNIFTITNNTSYYWPNVSIVLVQKNNRVGERDSLYGKSIIEIPEIEPGANAKIFLSSYDYRLIRESGYYLAQAFYHNHAVSNSISISTVNIIEITANKAGAALKLKNNYFETDISIEYAKNGSTKKTKLKLRNFETKYQILLNVISGDKLDIKITSEKEKILLCPEFKYTVE